MPILHLFEAFLTDFIHLLALSKIVLLNFKVKFSILKVDFRHLSFITPPRLFASTRKSSLIYFQRLMSSWNLSNTETESYNSTMIKTHLRLIALT